MIMFELATRAIPFRAASNDYMIISKIQVPQLSSFLFLFPSHFPDFLSRNFLFQLGFTFEPTEDVPADFAMALKKCLLTDPKKRPSFHSVVLKDLEQDTEENGFHSEPVTLIDSKSPVISRKKKDKEADQVYKQGLQYFEGKSGQRNFKKAVKV